MKRKYKKQLNLIEQNKGITIPYKIPEELKHPIQLQKGLFESFLGELGKIFDLLIEPILIITNTVIPILYKLVEVYINSLTKEEIENYIWLAKNQKYFGW